MSGTATSTTTDSRSEQPTHEDVPDGLQQGAVVRHTLFDQYDEQVYAVVEEVVIPEVSQYRGGHARLRSSEWENPRTALLDNLALEQPAEQQTRPA